MSKNIFSFDVESDGLYGEGFAVGAVVLNDKGEQIDSFSGMAEVKKVENQWVKDNVIPNLEGIPEYLSRKEMRDAFWDFWMKYKKDSICIADIGAPVESAFMKQCVMDYIENREFNGPYPLHEVATTLEAAGIDPDIKREEFIGEDEDKKHNPCHDAKVSAKCYLKAKEILLERAWRSRVAKTIAKNLSDDKQLDRGF